MTNPRPFGSGVADFCEAISGSTGRATDKRLGQSLQEASSPTDNWLLVGTLAAVQRKWGPLNPAEGAWLINQGVTPEAVLQPTPLGAARVTFLDGGTFTVANTEGVTKALTFRVSNVDGEDIDLAAWSPRTGEIGSWYGRAFALGEDQIFNPATYFGGDALRVHADPWRGSRPVEKASASLNHVSPTR